MKIEKIGLGNFKSIGDDLVWINYKKKVNVYIGANNSGKSNILSALYFLSNQYQTGVALSSIDQHKRDKKNKIRICIKATIEESDGLTDYKEEHFTIDYYIDRTEIIWKKGPIPTYGEKNYATILNIFMIKYKGKHFPRPPTEEKFRSTRKEIHLKISNELIEQIIPTFFIPQFRQITPGSEYTISGQGIVEMLASWQHPEINFDGHIKHFQKIQDLLRRLLDLSNIEMEVDHTKNHIIVKDGNLRLPLESYGTGVHELIILAIAVYSKDNVYYLMEEPEIHLHPKLQKEFLKFIINETSNKYLITTHSNALIQPSADVEVAHLRLDDGATKYRRVESSVTILDILSDLGITPSDILQTNSVIWVEGPSDRIYLNKWIKLLYPSLIEGIDYSIMFYGGRLLSHLSMDRDDDPSPEDFISLLKINQKSIIMIDSDRRKKGAQISYTKQRIKSECVDNDIYCWITDGREIENYLSNKSVSRTYTDLTGFDVEVSVDKYNTIEEALKSACGNKWKNKWSYDKKKPYFARMIIKNIGIDDINKELLAHLSELHKVISIRS